MGPFALSPRDVTEDFPVVTGTVRSVDGRQGLAILQEHACPVFLAGARKVEKV